MRFLNFLSSATLALTANALLLPLNTPDNVHLTKNVLSTEKQTLYLECQDCPIALESDTNLPHEWKTTDNPPSKLVLDFTVEGQQVKVNGVPIYPPSPESGMGLRAKQVTSDKDIKTFRNGIPLSTIVEVQGVKAIAGSDGVMKVHSISIDIIGFSSSPGRFDTVRVLIAEGVGNTPMLLPIQTTPYQPSPIKDSCTNVFCRFRATIIAKVSALRAAAAARLNRFRGCGRPGSVKDSGAPRILPGHRRPHLQGLGAQNTAHHRFRHALRRFIRVVVLPIFFGITSGLVIGAFSMLVWTAVASIVRRVSGNKPPSYEELAQAEEGNRASVEVEGEGPPKYEEVYTEPEDDISDEKKQLL